MEAFRHDSYDTMSIKKCEDDVLALMLVAFCVFMFFELLFTYLAISILYHGWQEQVKHHKKKDEKKDKKKKEKKAEKETQIVQAPMGQASMGQAPIGQAPIGQAPIGEMGVG
mmetsp:Transcript_20640/g.25320  ORF Transcript_20640/g.25320 Transcript_20640/m.25320 type:complete len:112 (+) Transcript_20640:313-648(+)